MRIILNFVPWGEHMEYKTEQKNAVLCFLKQNYEHHFTANQIVDALQKTANPPAKSSVYRIISSLVKNGKIRRFESNSEKNFVYQYAHLSDTCENHYHLKCTDCGKLIHMECEHLSNVCRHIASEHGFLVGTGKSIIYGTCRECLKEK